MSDTFTVGPGVQQAMSDHGDEPRSDEMFIVNVKGSKISQTFGTQGIYYWEEQDNATRVVPFR